MRVTDHPPTDTPAGRFYDSALERVRRFILVLGVAGVLVCLVGFGRVVTAGFVVGAVISYVNHVWLERVINGLGERIASGQSTERGGIIVARAVLRYVFLAAGAYVIFRVSLAGLYGFLAGICLTIAAFACEAVVEIFAGFRSEL
jgi:ATP synthase I subunit